MMVEHLASDTFLWFLVFKNDELIPAFVLCEVFIKGGLYLIMNIFVQSDVRPFERIERRIQHNKSGVRNSLQAAIAHESDSESRMRYSAVSLA